MEDLDVASLLLFSADGKRPEAPGNVSLDSRLVRYVTSCKGIIIILLNWLGADFYPPVHFNLIQF